MDPDMDGRGKGITINAPAKLNTYLKIVGKRDDGYHEIVSVMIPITLFDTLHFSPSKSGIHLSCHGREIESDSSNLVYKACNAFYRNTGISPGIKIELHKRIPVGAGLGGGSSDAAFTLSVLNYIHGKPLDFKGLLNLATTLGADVPFFLYQRPCLAQGIGEKLRPIEKWPSFWYVIIVPPIQVSTGWVYGNLKLELTENLHSYIISRLSSMAHESLAALDNDLETVTLKQFPEIAKLKSLLIDAGAKGALMSGSGSSVFGVFPDKEKALKAKNKLEQRELGEIFVTTLWRKDKAGLRNYREVFP